MLKVKLNLHRSLHRTAALANRRRHVDVDVDVSNEPKQIQEMHYVLLQSFGPRAHVLEKCSANDNEVLTFFKDRLEGRVVKIDATYTCRAFPEDSLPQIGAAMQSFQLLASLEGQEGFANVVFKGGDLTALYAIPENTEDSSFC